jgi:hypothetical protein
MRNVSDKSCRENQNTHFVFSNISPKLCFITLGNLLRGISFTVTSISCTFLIISRSVLLRMRNVSDKSCRENQNTHFVFSNISPKLCFITLGNLLRSISFTVTSISCTFFIISRSILLRMRNVSEKFVESIKKHFIFNNFSPKIVPV